MKVFLTGGTGFVGSAIAQELLLHGHSVLALARSAQSAAALGSGGLEVLQGDLRDLETLREGAAACDAVIHAGFNTAFSENDGPAKQRQNCQDDSRAIEAIGRALEGSRRPFVVTSGTALVCPGRLAQETDAPVFTEEEFPRVLTEHAADAVAARDVLISVVRLSPTVHGRGDHGFIPLLRTIATEKGVSAYVGNGDNRWSAVHRLDAARLYRLALNNTVPGARFHAAAESGVAFCDIALAIAHAAEVPVASISADEAEGHFGWFRRFAALDAPVSAKTTQERLGWNPSEGTLLEDIGNAEYFDEGP